MDNPLRNDSFAYKYSFCYMYCNKEVIKKNSEDLITLTYYLTETLSIFNIHGYHYVAGSGIDEFFTMHRGNNLTGFNA